MMVNLQASVSNLQRLFTTASSQRGQRQHESVIEESHTYDLLYHEGGSHAQGQHHVYPLPHGDPVLIAAAASSADDRGGLDIQSPRDVRIVIAQDANTRSPQPRILYDSHPPLPSYQGRNGSSPETTPVGRQRADSFTGGITGGGHRRNNSIKKSSTAPHSRHSSLSQTTQSILTSPSSPLSPVNEIGGLFGNYRTRVAPTRPVTSNGESVQGKIARECREETEALLECMFGSATGLPSTSSTKLHVRPPKPTSVGNHSQAGYNSRETPSFPKRRTPLTRSTTAADFQALSVDAVQQATRDASSAIWITRLFSVDLNDPSTGFHRSDAPPSGAIDTLHANGTVIEGESYANVSREKTKQLKTPTYAIAILLQMPMHKARPFTPLQRSFSSSGSGHSWHVEDSTSIGTAAFEFNSDIEYVISHWAMIDRVLSSLEGAARSKISEELGKIDIPYMAPAVKTSPNSADMGSPTKPKRPKQPTQLTLQLPVSALQSCKMIQDIASSTGKRVALGLKIRKVVAGQGRWGVWREEARWIDRWAGGREHNFFFFNLLTAFVGCHTQWLDSLAPSKYKRRHTKYAREKQKESNAIHHRTVIVSLDKMAARRLIFLLSAFLPGTYSNLVLDEQNRGEPYWSGQAYSQSPPVGMPIRKQSLRRHMHRSAREASAKNLSHGRSISFSRIDPPPSDDVIESDPSLLPVRRPSEAKSVRSGPLLIAADGSASRKSSTSTVKPAAAYPVPHFAGPSTDVSLGNAPGERPTSSESLAPLSLQRTLSRSESTEQGNSSPGSQPKSGWGSVFSSFLGVRRGSSTDRSDFLGSSDEGLGISGVLPDPRPLKSATTLSQMVQDAEHLRHPPRQGYRTTTPKSSSTSNGYLHASPSFTSGVQGTSPTKDAPDRPLPESFPLKLSIDVNDGVIDIDLPPSKSFPSSFASSGSSPLALNTAASSFNDRSSLYLRSPLPSTKPPVDETAGDVAGWLRSYHQDFTLQAVRPYDSLKEDIKRSMLAEPNPTSHHPSTCDPATGTLPWTDMATTLIADTTTFTVTRLTLRRKLHTAPRHGTNALPSEGPSTHDKNASEEQQILEEQLMDMDPVFIDAVEKVLSHSGESSRVASRAASRATSPTRNRHAAVNQTRRNSHTPTHAEGAPGLEVPRSECKKMVLGALEQVARTVGEEMVVRNAGGEDGGKRARRRDAGGDAAKRREVETVMESTLREGVRNWFREVDGAAVAAGA